jgi:hypothetical protein
LSVRPSRRPPLPGRSARPRKCQIADAPAGCSPILLRSPSVTMGDDVDDSNPMHVLFDLFISSFIQKAKNAPPFHFLYYPFLKKQGPF